MLDDGGLLTEVDLCLLDNGQRLLDVKKLSVRRHGRGDGRFLDELLLQQTELGHWSDVLAGGGANQGRTNDAVCCCASLNNTTVRPLVAVSIVHDNQHQVADLNVATGAAATFCARWGNILSSNDY